MANWSRARRALDGPMHLAFLEGRRDVGRARASRADFKQWYYRRWYVNYRKHKFCSMPNKVYLYKCSVSLRVSVDEMFASLLSFGDILRHSYNCSAAR